MRDTQKIVKIDGKQFRITQFNALDGGTVFLFVIRKVVPLLKAADIDVDKMVKEGSVTSTLDEITTIITPVLESITKDDLQEFMGLCLSQVEELLPAGYERVFKHGEFAVDDVKYSTKLAFMLCYHAIEGLVKDFFGDHALKFLDAFKKNMSQSNQKE